MVELMNDNYVSDAHVKVIGSANHEFVSGETDLRGLFIADDIRGTGTVIAALGKRQYAFFRGDTSLQVVSGTASGDPFGSDETAPPTETAGGELGQQAAGGNQAQQGKQSLRDNLFRQNSLFQEVQKGNYNELLNNERSGIKSKEAF